MFPSRTDQLFGVIAALLAREMELENPKAFRDAIFDKLKRPRPEKRDLVVEMQDAMRAWVDYLRHLSISFSGYTEGEAAHSVRLTRRRCTH